MSITPVRIRPEVSPASFHVRAMPARLSPANSKSYAARIAAACSGWCVVRSGRNPNGTGPAGGPPLSAVCRLARCWRSDFCSISWRATPASMSAVSRPAGVLMSRSLPRTRAITTRRGSQASMSRTVSRRLRVRRSRDQAMIASTSPAATAVSRASNSGRSLCPAAEVSFSGCSRATIHPRCRARVRESSRWRVTPSSSPVLSSLMRK